MHIEGYTELVHHLNNVYLEVDIYMSSHWYIYKYESELTIWKIKHYIHGDERTYLYAYWGIHKACISSTESISRATYLYVK